MHDKNTDFYINYRKRWTMVIFSEQIKIFNITGALLIFKKK